MSKIDECLDCRLLEACCKHCILSKKKKKEEKVKHE